MPASIRSLCLAGGLALLAACQGGGNADNLADLDARLTNGANDAAEADAAIALAAAGGQIEKAPVAVQTKAVASQGQPIGNAVQGPCARDVKMGREWADRMPASFRLYPGATLVEAGNVDKEECTLRVISFTTPAGIDPVLDYYYTQAKRAGFDGEHLLSGGEHQLGGTSKDGGAYVVFARLKDGKTEVEVIANAP